MHERIIEAESALGLNFGAVRDAATGSEEALNLLRNDARHYLVTHGVLTAGQQANGMELGLVAFGSIARGEISASASDFDHAIVAYHPIEHPENIQKYRRAAKHAQQSALLKDPGQSRIFGGIISSTDLINRIGLEDDTNRSHTQRMLFLEESVPVLNDESHQATLRSIVRRYLIDYQNSVDASPLHKCGVPRFLLNDIVRYWRTLAVDYQAKRWDELSADLEPIGRESAVGQVTSPKWGMRYIKLRSSRKLAYAGTVTSLLMPRIRYVQVTDDLLLEQFRMPPLARLAQLLPYLHDDDTIELGEILKSANWFAANFAMVDFRNEVNKVEHPRLPTTNQTFKDARQETQLLQQRLEALFQSNKPLQTDAPDVDNLGRALTMQQLTSRYLLF